jgi:hypothetical protein
MSFFAVKRSRCIVFVALTLSSFRVNAQIRPQFYQTPAFQGGPAIVVADFNNDGKPEIVTGNMILIGNGDGTFKPPQNLSVAGSVVATADFNNDGNLLCTHLQYSCRCDRNNYRRPQP